MDENGITGHLDGLLCRGVALEELIRSAATFVEGCVGWASAPGQGVAFDAEGRALPVDRPPGGRKLPVPARGYGSVWVEAADLDDSAAATTLSRLAVAVAITVRWQAHGQNLLPPLEVLLDPAVTVPARNAALARVGAASATRVRVVVCDGPAVGVESFVQWLTRSHRVLTRARVRERTVLLLLAHGRSMAAPAVPLGVKAAYSAPVPAEQVRAAYLNARDAFRFARPSQQESGPYPLITGVWLDGEELRTIGLLSRIAVDDIAQLPDVRAVERVRAANGELVLRVLEAYTASASMRTAAEMVHLHHNSVRYWIHKVELELGYSLSEPYARAQLFITLCLHRLWAEPAPDGD